MTPSGPTATAPAARPLPVPEWPVPEVAVAPADGCAGRPPTPTTPPRRRPDSPAHPTPHRPTVRVTDLLQTAALLIGVFATTFVVGRLVAGRPDSLLHDRMLPWILGRGLGVAAYLALAATVLCGLWIRHPLRPRFRGPSAAGVLWAHVYLAAASVVLVAGHVTALALDRYAGVGWTGALVPWAAHDRPTPVALGTLALYGLVLVVATAALAGSLARSLWFPVHRAAVLVFCLTLAHGVTAGSDGSSLRWVYAGSGLAVAGLAVTRWATHPTVPDQVPGRP
jgi:hypothetical protein